MTPSLLLVIAALTIQPASAATRTAYPNVNKPHAHAGRAFTAHARVGIRPNIVKMNIPESFFDEKMIELEFKHGAPASLLNRKKTIAIDGYSSLALLPADPKPGDSMTILSKFPQFGRHPAKTQRLTAKSLAKLERALQKLNHGDYQDVPAVMRVLDQQIDGTQTPVASALAVMNPDHFAVVPGMPDNHELMLTETRLKPKHAHHLSLSLGHRNSRSIDIFTSYFPAKYGWQEANYRLSRAMTARSPKLRRVARVLKNIVERATRTRRTFKVEQILSRLRMLSQP